LAGCKNEREGSKEDLVIDTFSESVRKMAGFFVGIPIK
jgi:hypothetical protein